MPFSSRVPSDLTPNRLAAAVQRLQAAGEPFIDLTESNPTRAGFDYPSDLLQTLADPRSLVYRPNSFGLPDARAAAAAEFARCDLDVSPACIVLTSSTSEAYSLLFKLLCDAGDEVLVPRPSYPLFEHLTRLDAIVPEPYDLEYHGRWTMDIPGLAQRISSKTRAVLAVNPNNPTGSFVTLDELDRLGSLCRRRSLALIGDEVFADYGLLESTRTSVLQQRDALAFSLGGLSKSAGLPQMKLGWIGIGGPTSQVAAALRHLDVIADTYLSVATPVQWAAAGLIQAGADVRRQIQERLATNLGVLTGMVDEHPSCRLLRAEAGWYAVVQVPAIRSEESLILDLLERDRVLVHPGYFFDFPVEAFVVVSLLPRADMFARGIRVMLQRAGAAS